MRISTRLLSIMVIGVAGVVTAWYGIKFGSVETGDRRGSPDAGTQGMVSIGYALKDEGVDEALSRGEVAELRKEVVSLRGDLAALRKLIQTQIAQLPTVREEIAEESPENTEDSDSATAAAREEERRRKDHELEQARARANETAFAGESIDKKWVNDTVPAIQNALSSKNLQGTMAKDVQCRSTLCRVEVVHENAEQRSLFERDFPMAMGQILPSGAIHTTEYEDGASVTTLYLAKPGASLPQDQVQE